MLLLELKNIVKYAGNRCLFKFAGLKIYSGNRIGIVGPNGVGKSTLLQIMAGTIPPDEGTVRQYASSSYISQLEASKGQTVMMHAALAGQFKIGIQYLETMSGGEKTRYKIAAALSEKSALLFADEPTANLDIKGVELFQHKLLELHDTFVIISHDRQLLEAVCNRIWEIDDEKVKMYTGNFADYLAQKEVECKRQAEEYESYISEKKKLQTAVADRKQRAVSMKKTPKRMGNSEARLHKMGNQKAQANLHKAVQAMETRLRQLEAKEKPKNCPAAIFDITDVGDLYSKVVLRAEELSKCFGNRRVFTKAEFSIFNGQKVALVGDNGCGKTTLLNMIVAREKGIHVSVKARFGYVSQAMERLVLDQSILENVMAESIYDERFVRLLLARLLFRQTDVYKQADVLSGGERTRVALAKIIAGKANVLLLDEPTNYLDLPAITALEAVLTEYKGTILFASHDRKFINRIATHLMLFEDGKIRTFSGNYDQYLRYKEEHKEKPPTEDKVLFEYRLTEVLSKLSIAKDKDHIERLDKEYRDLLSKLKERDR